MSVRGHYKGHEGGGGSRPPKNFRKGNCEESFISKGGNTRKFLLRKWKHYLQIAKETGDIQGVSKKR
jgi:hypothetical protein